jgi:hypothetical protein
VAPLPDLNNASGLQDYMKERDPVRLLQKTLPQNAARYAERTKQFLKSAHFNVHKNKQGDYVVDSYDIYGGDTLELKFLKIFNREDVWHIYNSFNLVEVPQGNIVKKEIGIGYTMTISTDDNEQFEQVKDAFVSFDADKITQFIPGFWNKIHVQNEYNAEGRFFKYLFSKCMLQQEPVNKEVSNFISKYDYFFHFLNFTGGVNKSQKQIISRLSDSVLFYNAVERYNLDEQKPGYVGKVDVASKKNLRCAFIFDETERKVWAFVFKQENQSLVFLNAYKRSNVRQNKREVYKAVKTMPGMPVYLISTDASGKELISFDEGMQQIKDEQNQKKLAKKQQIAATTSVVDKFKQLKKLNTQDRRTYMQQHGTMMPIKVGRKTIVGNNPVLVAPFGDAVALLATATKNNMESIATAFNITWEKIIIEPVAQRPAFSFFIKGKKRDGTVVYYCRKEFNAAGAGQSYVINASTGNQFVVSRLMSIIAKQETHQINI